MKRPLVVPGLLYVAGILLGLVATPLTGLLVAAFLLLLITLGWARARPWLLCPLLVLTGWINLAQRTVILAPNDMRTVLGGQTALASIRGMLTETPQPHFHQRRDQETETTTATVELRALARNPGTWEPVTGRIVVFTKAALPETYFAGQTVEISGVLGKPDAAFAPGLFDYQSYLANQGVYYELKADSAAAWQVLSSPARPPLADRWRTWSRRMLARGLPVEDQTLRLEWALTLGWKAALTEPVTEPFIRAAP